MVNQIQKNQQNRPFSTKGFLFVSLSFTIFEELILSSREIRLPNISKNISNHRQWITFQWIFNWITLNLIISILQFLTVFLVIYGIIKLYQYITLKIKQQDLSWTYSHCIIQEDFLRYFEEGTEITMPHVKLSQLTSPVKPQEKQIFNQIIAQQYPELFQQGWRRLAVKIIIPSNIYQNCGKLISTIYNYYYAKEKLLLMYKFTVSSQEYVKQNLNDPSNSNIFWQLTLEAVDKIATNNRDNFHRGVLLGSLVSNPVSNMKQITNVITKLNKKTGYIKALKYFEKSIPLPCRFCHVPIPSDYMQKKVMTHNEFQRIPALKNRVCGDPFCIEAARNVCEEILSCGHPCNGLKNEKQHLGCLEPLCEYRNHSVDKHDLCSSCFTDGLHQLPSIKSECGHFFHHQCVVRQLETPKDKPELSYSFRNCGLCRNAIRHESLKQWTDKIDEEEEALLRCAKQHVVDAEIEKLDAILSEDSEYYNKPIEFVLKKFFFYQCFECKTPYVGPEAECKAAGAEEEEEKKYNPAEYRCTKHWGGNDENEFNCNKHGQKYLMWKCKYCCRPAMHLCDSSHHFCNPCHNNSGILWDKDEETMEWAHQHCHAPEKNHNKMPNSQKFDKCPLGCHHPPHGKIFSFGCVKCKMEEMNAGEFLKDYNSNWRFRDEE